MTLVLGSEHNHMYEMPCTTQRSRESTTHIKCIPAAKNGWIPINSNFMVTPCINNIQHFNFQLTHTTLKNVELLKHFKISKTAPTCFGLQGNHHQGATVNT